MAIFTSKKLQLQVLQALKDADRPMRTAEVAAVVGKTAPAVAAALEQSGARKLLGYPAKWTIDGANTIIGSRIAPSKFEGEQYVVTTAPTDELVAAWNEKCEAVGAALTKLHITPKSDPAELALQLGTIAGSLAALAELS